MKRLEEVLSSISEAIAVVRLCKCDSVVALLEMAELELRMKVHDISDAELSMFCQELEKSRQHDWARPGHPAAAKI